MYDTLIYFGLSTSDVNKKEITIFHNREEIITIFAQLG